MSRHFPYRLLLLLWLPFFLSGCNEPKNELERVQQQGKLVVLTRNAATTYYEGPQGYTGLEYDLARGFAEKLGVQLEMVVAANVSEVLSLLAQGKADLAAAGLTVTHPRQQWARFTPSYQEITQQLVYRSGKRRPRSLDKLDGILEITASSSHEEQLHMLQMKHRNLSWSENHELESEDLLTMVWDKVLDYTVADSNEVAMYRRFYPELRVAFDISQPQQLAWAFPKHEDDSLYLAASDYFKQLKESGYLARLIERYYGHLEDFDYVGTRTYMLHMHQRLPRYRAMFEYAATEFGVDWRLLAATAYQESHWDPDAISPTGVRGIMMLTKATASDLGVDRRTDPVQSIRGGALYLKQMLGKIPQRISEPDHSWLALAAYNIGFGHLEDARIITQRQGGDPDSWKDVKQYLPLLRKHKWHSQTKHGYARGNEAVRYVENIRSYYDILSWFTDQERPDAPTSPKALRIATPAL
jgi:membrane-bound lytic murein transglycosylase F